MNSARVAAAFLSMSLVACGGDDTPHTTPDASHTPDAARVCTGVTSGTLDFIDYDAQNKFLRWGGPITGTLGGGNLIYQFEFYGGIESSLAGTFDLHSGNQSNYATCAVCVRAFEVDAQNNVTKRFFQSGGSITLTEDPFTNQHMIASLSNLQLEEVTIDSQSFTSTPVAGGACMSFADYNVDHDKVPNAWTCPHAGYNDGTNCNCMCGTPDADCNIDTAPVMGCTTVGNRCANDMCVAPPTNDTCTAATLITLPLAAPLTGSTAGANHDYNMGLEGQTCTGFAQPGPDVAYKVVLGNSQQVTVTLSGLAATYDGSVALVGPDAGTPGSVCSNAITTCVKGADAGVAGDNETFTYTTTATGAGTYYIIVDSFDAGVSGTFSLNVTSP